MRRWILAPPALIPLTEGEVSILRGIGLCAFRAARGVVFEISISVVAVGAG